MDMTDDLSASDQDFAFQIAPDGIAEILPLGPLSPQVSDALARRVLAKIAAQEPPTGLLIDVRATRLLSLVRLSNLLDALSATGIRVAVVFWDEEQRKLAGLLHNTLAQKERVAYFTTLAEARAYLLEMAPGPNSIA
jgi:hypothetical protein